LLLVRQALLEPAARVVMVSVCSLQLVKLRRTTESPFSRHATGASAAATVTAVNSPSKAIQGSHVQSQHWTRRASATTVG
jgi:hypothetical protein